LDIRARGFWESQRSAFFDIRVCHPNADSYKDLELRQVYKIHENEKKRLYARRVLEIEQGTFTPLVFTTTGDMGKECVRYHSRLAELVAIKKGEDYATTMSWIRARTSFALLRSALTCLRGSRARKIMYDIRNIDFNIENAETSLITKALFNNSNLKRWNIRDSPNSLQQHRLWLEIYSLFESKSSWISNTDDVKCYCVVVFNSSTVEENNTMANDAKWQNNLDDQTNQTHNEVFNHDNYIEFADDAAVISGQDRYLLSKFSWHFTVATLSKTALGVFSKECSTFMKMLNEKQGLDRSRLDEHLRMSFLLVLYLEIYNLKVCGSSNIFVHEYEFHKRSSTRMSWIVKTKLTLLILTRNVVPSRPLEKILPFLLISGSISFMNLNHPSSALTSENFRKTFITLLYAISITLFRHNHYCMSSLDTNLENNKFAFHTTKILCGWSQFAIFLQKSFKEWNDRYKRGGGGIIQRHNQLRDLEAELLNIVCNDVQIEPILQEINGEPLDPGANRSLDARLDVHARGFWERQRSAFFDIRVCHPNAESYRDLTPVQIYRIHENEKKRMYNNRIGAAMHTRLKNVKKSTL
ncbi:Hypothetical predicted protein, partial [Paramuricea clavata]